MLSAEDAAHLHAHGFVVLEHFLAPDELASSLTEVGRVYPEWVTLSRDPERFASLHARPDAGAGVQFPYDGHALNRDALHPRLLDTVQQLLGPEVRLYQSHLWAKYASVHDYDQDLHLDYRNHTLLVPDDPPRQIEAIYYYTDVTAELGPTCVVSRAHTGMRPLTPFVRSRDADPELYAHEQAIVAPAGSLLLYTPRTWHRGSAIRAREGMRIAHHLAFRRADTEWAGNTSWPGRAADSAMAAVMATTTVEQQAALGVPRPGHPFWTDETLQGVAARYPGMDLTTHALAMAGAAAT